MDKLERLKQLEAELELKKLKQQLPHKYTPLYTWQREFINSRNKINLLTASNQPLRWDELIPTPEGYVKNGDLKIGDKVYGSDGNISKVIDIPFEGFEDEYKITFDDNSSIIAGPDHKWICKGEQERFNKKDWKGKIREGYNQWQVKTTREIIESGKYSPETLPRLRHSIPVCKPVDFPEKDLPIDPYLLGCLIGDGSMRSSVTLTSMDDEVISAFGDSIKTLYNKKGSKAYSGVVQGVKPKLRDLGLFGTLSYTKFIPDIYKIASIQQRKDLLAGLLDTDGCVEDDFKHFSYCTTSEQLKDDFIEILNSLGGIINSVKERYTKYNKGTKTGRKSYTINFKTLFNPFRLKRRAEKWKAVEKYRHERIIYKIEKTGKKSLMRCITVDNEDHSYLASKSYIVTHNSGKSVSLIVRAISHATETELWPELWPKSIAEGRLPSQFWYLYEDKGMIMREFESKWMKEWLPRGKARYEGKYRWKYKVKDKCIEYLEFEETGVRIYFFSYGQGVSSIQASTVFEIFVDEELPFEHYDELSFRLTIPRGYFNAGFTATKGQEEWRRAMEEKGEEELFKTAFKRQISAYDCKVKEDGSDGLWDDELIKLKTAQCSTHNEVLKRIYGKFVKAEGLMVPQFDIKRHFVKGHMLNPKTWNIWSAIDPGSGGNDAHPAGIVFVAVNDECTKARVIKCWRGDKQNTTNTQILQKHQEMAKGLNLVGTIYDKQSRDLFLQAVALNVPLIPANKTRDDGFATLNSLFKHDMLKIYYVSDGDESHKLKNELLSYSSKHSKSKATCPDNLIDPLRYLCLHIAWNFDAVIQYNLTSDKPEKREIPRSERDRYIKAEEEGRLDKYIQSAKEQASVLGNELDEWDDYFNSYHN